MRHRYCRLFFFGGCIVAISGATSFGWNSARIEAAPPAQTASTASAQPGILQVPPAANDPPGSKPEASAGSPTAPVTTGIVQELIADLEARGANSHIAIAIGNAEGTRGKDGEETDAYNGHVDPGNNAWNKGTFSWQASPCPSPEACDQLGLERLERAIASLESLDGGPEVLQDPWALLNYLDLVIQAPIAAVDYPWRRKESKGDELQARVRSYIDPTTGQWDAPGLGNNEPQITRDQDRRMQAMWSYLHQHYPDIFP